jgi:anaerobic C4-dicarboxylate transporter
LYTMTLKVGTGHTVYVIQPIIANVARKTRVRPERPGSVALVSIIVNSQAATACMLGPLAFQLGVAPATLIGIFPSVYAYFLIPNYPSDLATVNFDRTGTTRIGKYLLNHSFMLPGMVGVWTACLGWALAG